MWILKTFERKGNCKGGLCWITLHNTKAGPWELPSHFQTSSRVCDHLRWKMKYMDEQNTGAGFRAAGRPTLGPVLKWFGCSLETAREREQDSDVTCGERRRVAPPRWAISASTCLAGCKAGQTIRQWKGLHVRRGSRRAAGKAWRDI